jgi:hypothetical protein
MRIGDFFDAINQTLTISRPPRSECGYIASIPYGEIKIKGGWQSPVGHGVTPNEAMRDLAREISNRKITFNVNREDEQTFRAPHLRGGG